VANCVVTGYVFKPNNQPKPGVEIRIVRVLKDQLLTAASPSLTRTLADGSFTFTVPRGPNCLAYIEAVIEGFNVAGGTPVEIPDAGAATLMLLQTVNDPPGFATVIVPRSIMIKVDGTVLDESATIINFEGATADSDPPGQVNVSVQPFSQHLQEIADIGTPLQQIRVKIDEPVLEYFTPPTGGPPTWGQIVGTLFSQTDLNLALNAKQNIARQQNSQIADYTTTILDSGGHVFHPASDNNPRTFTIADNVNLAYPLGTTIIFVNKINTVTIAIVSDILTMAGTGSTGNRSLAANGIATAMKIADTEWIISGTGLT